MHCAARRGEVVMIKKLECWWYLRKLNKAQERCWVPAHLEYLTMQLLDRNVIPKRMTREAKLGASMNRE
jgi:hypothetical protein